MSEASTSLKEDNMLNRSRIGLMIITALLAALITALPAHADPAGGRSMLDRLLTPLNKLGTKRFLTEARRKVWDNARRLDAARRRGSDAYDARLRELEELSAARVADLRAPGQVLLKLALRGFGVQLPESPVS